MINVGRALGQYGTDAGFLAPRPVDQVMGQNGPIESVAARHNYSGPVPRAEWFEQICIFAAEAALNPGYRPMTMTGPTAFGHRIRT